MIVRSSLELAKGKKIAFETLLKVEHIVFKILYSSILLHGIHLMVYIFSMCCNRPYVEWRLTQCSHYIIEIYWDGLTILIDVFLYCAPSNSEKCTFHDAVFLSPILHVYWWFVKVQNTVSPHPRAPNTLFNYIGMSYMLFPLHIRSLIRCTKANNVQHVSFNHVSEWWTQNTIQLITVSIHFTYK